MQLQHYVGKCPRLYCFPFAGGTSLSYRPLIKSGQLLRNCNAYALELPGRGVRMQEPLTQDIATIKNECLQAIIPYVDYPLVFFGHSMGAILAFELLADLEAAYPQLNAHLIVSASNAPKHSLLKHDVSQMNDGEFIALLLTMGGIPPAISKNEALMQFFLPRIRSDFALLKQYKVRDQVVLRSPLSVIAASDDDNLQHAAVIDWQQYTQANYQITWCTGGHFYLEDNLNLLSDLLNQALTGVRNGR